MELIIKPTNRCNFACTFCSSNKISNAIFDLQFLKKYLIQNFVSTIIVNGGDPLMMDPQFYRELIKFIEQHKLDTTISLTTNLWDFYINPQKWKDIFNNYRIGITTSFQYGPGRYLATGQPYTEQLFLKVQDKFFKYCNYNVDFISVITDQNQQYALDNILLAKKLNVECKLNGAVASGRQTKMYNLHKLYNIYLTILKNNLTDWEYNTKNLINHFKNLHTTCPLTNQTCKDNIRCMQANMNITMCPALDDDNIKDSTIYRNYKQQCYICQYYMICNGCMKRIKDLKEEKPDCTQLKKILAEFKSICLNI